MAHFSPVNGAFPHKNQIDRTCPVAVRPNGDYEKIQRGCIVYVNSNGKFALADTTGDNKDVWPLYFALQDYDDTQAAMAGEALGPGKGVVVGYAEPGDHTDGITKENWLDTAPGANHEAAAYGQPAITGLSFQESGNYQTDMFDRTKTYEVGMELSVKDGCFKPKESDEKAVARVYAKPYMYYANDAVNVRGWSTGAYIKVLRVSVG